MIGAASMLTAWLAYFLAWRGGLWAVLICVVLAAVTWWSARRREASGRTRAGLAMAGIALVVAGLAFATSGGINPALRTDGSSYAPGDTVRVQLKAGIRSVGYNLCLVSFERLDAAGWQFVPHIPPGSACILVQVGLRPLFGAEASVDLPRHSRPGLYRLKAGVVVGGEYEERTLATRPFAVRR